MSSLPTIIAHRGASGYAPENTFAAFDKALALGFPDIEFDIRASKDGVPVVIHDAWVDRTTNASMVLSPRRVGRLASSLATSGDSTGGPHAVADLTVAELQALDAGAWFGAEFSGQRIPTLEELFARYASRARCWVEVKEVGLEGAVLALVERYGLEGRTAALSFEPEVVSSLAHRSAGRLHLGWLVVQLSAEVMEQAVGLGANGLYPHIDSVTAELAAAARARGLGLGAWGVAGEEQIARAVTCGLDGFVHNYPDQARAQAERFIGQMV